MMMSCIARALFKTRCKLDFLLPFLDTCYQFRVPRNLRIDIKDRLEEYSQSIEIDIHDCTQSQKSLNIEIQSILNSQCDLFIWEIN